MTNMPKGVQAQGRTDFVRAIAEIECYSRYRYMQLKQMIFPRSMF